MSEETTTAETTATTRTATTEIALRPFAELAALDLSREFLDDYAPLNPEAQAELYQELDEDGVELRMSDLTRVKVPTGGTTQFMIFDEDGVEQAVREIVGVVLATVDRRSFWQRKLDEAGGEGEEGGEGPPDCSSRDGQTGQGMYGVDSDLHPSGDCETCPMAARGSAGTGTQASKCKSQKLLFLASTMEQLPMIVTVPPGSLKSYRDFRVGNVAKRRRTGGGAKELKISLRVEKNPQKIKYGVLVFQGTGRAFSPDEAAVIREFSHRMKIMIKENEEALDRMAAAAANLSDMSDEADVVGGGAVPFGEDEADVDLGEGDGVAVGGSARKR